MAGIVDALLGGALGFSSGLVQNAKQQQQTEAEEAKENRMMGREAFLMELRDKYAKGQAEHADGLARGRATFESDLKLDSLNDKRVIRAEGRKRQDDVNEYDLKKKIDNEYASAKEVRDNAEWGRRNDIEYGQQKGLVNMRLSDTQARKGRGGADDDDAIGDPDFIGARKGLYGYLGIDAGADEVEMRAAKKRLGLPDNATPKVVQDVMKAATNVYAANPNLSPDEALKFGSEILYGKIKLGTAPVGGNGRQLQYFTAGGRRYGYGRPN